MTTEAGEGACATKNGEDCLTAPPRLSQPNTALAGRDPGAIRFLDAVLPGTAGAFPGAVE